MGNIAGNQNRDRVARDNYPTDPAWVVPLLTRVLLPGAVWEPAAGDGAISNELMNRRFEVISSDLATGQDFLTCSKPPGVESIVTNPPFTLLAEFIKRGLGHDPTVLALLVGLHYLGGEMRAREIYRPTPPTRVLIIPQRMRVYGKVSQFNHAWLVWSKYDDPDMTALEWVDAEKR